MAKSKKRDPILARLPKTLAEVFAADLIEDASLYVTLADLKLAVDAAVDDLPDGGRSVLLTTPTRIRGMGLAHGDGPVFDKINGIRLQVMTLGGQECALLSLDD